MQPQQQWNTFFGEPIQQTLKDEVSQVLQREVRNGHRIVLCIGSDSRVKGAVTEFATAVVFLRVGKGAFMLISKERSAKPFSLKERMMHEVSSSIAVAYELMEVAHKYGVHMEVHADINTSPEHRSHIAFSDAKGYANGMGFQFKAKPHAFAGSCCADKMVQ